MKSQLPSDILELMNGPEDGTEFPLTRSPVDIGSAGECAVNIRFDPGIRPRHARLSVVSEGYRVRQVDGKKVYVNGKRAGRIRSRILRAGGVLQVSGSEFFLHCAEDGLASRSHGLSAENDFLWILRLAGRRGLAFSKRVWNLVRSILGPFYVPLAVIGLMAVLLYWFLPGFFSWAWAHASWWLGWLRFQVMDWLF